MEYRLNIVLEKLSVVTLDVLRKLPYSINNKFTLYIRKGPLHSEKINKKILYCYVEIKFIGTTYQQKHNSSFHLLHLPTMKNYMPTAAHCPQ